MIKPRIKIQLSDIIKHTPDAHIFGDAKKEIEGIQLDSRKVSNGDLFVALRGDNTDGHLFIREAIQNGAIAVMGTRDEVDLPVPYIKVVEGRKALAHASAAFYRYPARKMVMIGVTGTDGKTTTSHLIRSILNQAGIKSGMISTVNAFIGEDVIDTGYHVTTPEAPDLQYYLWRMVDSGISHVIVEATSHGLAQDRVEACDFDIGVVTNITHEHLDFHRTYENYRDAKGKLFRNLGRVGDKSIPGLPLVRGAVLNKDDSAYSYLREISAAPQVSYSIYDEENANILATHIQVLKDGTTFNVKIRSNTSPGRGGRMDQFEIYMPFFGYYNVANCLAAIGVTFILLGLEKNAIQQGIADIEPISGRMEKIVMGQEFDVFVDFAHTPNALENALKAARNIIENKSPGGRLIAVFGSAGLRDREKRRMMAERSYHLSDFTILTAEDPRTESLAKILEEMVVGINNMGGREGLDFIREPDRREAIRIALRMAKVGDLVIVCGKGHERSMCFGETEYPWDDREAVRAALAEQLKIEGPEMPYLPT